MNKDDVKVKVNEKSIEELRRIYDGVRDIYDQVRIRILTYLGAEFALFSYLYIRGSEHKENILDKLFVPSEPYGVILYYLAFFSCIVAFILLIFGTQPVSWRYPTDIQVHEDINNKKSPSYLNFLEYIRKEYTDALKIDIKHCETKQWLLTRASYLLMFGGILLIIIKNF